MDKVKLLLGFLYAHKFKLLWVIFSAVFFLFVLFPFDDLTDLVSAQVAKLTGNQVFLQMEGMSLSVLNPGLKLKKVYVEGAGMPGVSADMISISPSAAALISKKPGGTVIADGIFRGHVEVTLKSGPKSESGAERQKLELSANQISLSDLHNFLSLPLELNGQLNLSSTAVADLSFQEQPDADVDLSIDKFELPAGSVNTMMGPVNVPLLKLQKVILKGRLSGGRLQISEGSFGKTGDDLVGTVTGGIAMQLKMINGNLTPLMGAYDLSVDMNVKRGLQEQAALFLTLLDQYKTPTSDGFHYGFKAASANVQMPPNFSGIQ